MTNITYPNLVISNKERILLMRIPETGIDHMLRDVDCQQVRDVLEFLKENDTVPYIGGGILKRHLTNQGDFSDSDIDILGVTPDDVDNEKLRELYSKLSNNIPRDISVKLGNTDFLTTPIGGRMMYMGGIIEKSFMLHKVPRNFSIPIDLCLMTSEAFMEQYSPVYLSLEK